MRALSASLGGLDLFCRWRHRSNPSFEISAQVSDDANVMLNGFGTVVNSLKMRAKPYLPQICGTIKWRLNNKSAKIRQQAADLIARIAVVMKVCFLYLIEQSTERPDLALLTHMQYTSLVED